MAMADGEKKYIYVRGVLFFVMPSVGSSSVGMVDDK